MPLYQVRGKTEAGSDVVRLLAARGEREALAAVRPSGIYVTEVRRLRGRMEPTFASRTALAAAPILPEDQALWFRHLAPLVKAGLCLPTALARIAARHPERRLAALAGALSREVEGGVPLSDALEARAGFFPAWVPTTLRAAEASGTLDRLLPAIHGELDLEASFHRRFAVPAAYLRASVVLGVVVPTIPFVMTLGTRGWATLAAIVCGIAGALVYGGGFVKRWLATLPSVRAAADSAVLALPGVGGLRRSLGLLRFVRVLRACGSAGLPLAGAWETAAACSGHAPLTANLARGSEALREGRGLAEALRASGLFSPEEIAPAAEAEAEGALERFLSWWEPHRASDSHIAADRAAKATWARLLIWAGVVVVLATLVGAATTLGNMLAMVESFFAEP